jgi:hypothetical protein
MSQVYEQREGNDGCRQRKRFRRKARWGTTCCRLAGPPADTGMGSDQVYLITYTLIIYAILEEVVTKHKDRFNTTCIARHTLPPVTCEFLVRLARLSPRRACPYSFDHHRRQPIYPRARLRMSIIFLKGRDIGYDGRGINGRPFGSPRSRVRE